MPGGRPRIELDYELIGKLAEIQCTHEEIAAVLGVSVSTLEHDDMFLQVFRAKRQGGKASLRRKQWLVATEDCNPTMLIWLGKNYLKQADKREVTGTDGEPIKIITVKTVADD